MICTVRKENNCTLEDVELASKPTAEELLLREEEEEDDV